MDNTKHTRRTRDYHEPFVISYTGRITLLFGSVAVITALIALLVLAVVWEGHFTQYARQNMQLSADATAETMAQRYEENGGWTPDDIDLAWSYPNSNVSMQITDERGNLIAGDDASWGSTIGEDGSVTDESANLVTSPIMVDGKRVGNVNVWARGASEALTQIDVDFKNNSYGAMAFAAVVAVILSCIIGYFAARGFVTPIKRITQTANEIKSGNLSARTDLVGTDEIAQLGMTFDDMAQSIENDRELELRLTNDVAHELRTPLMAMQATMEAMLDGVLPMEEQRLIVLNNEVIRLGKLVDALLKLSRLENRSTPTRLQRIDLGETLEDLVLSHEMLLEDQGLEFEYSYLPGIMVDADPDLIRQATGNILSNAVRYTPEGGSITIEVGRDATMAQIAVTDTGIGMSPDDLKHIFSRFWRADAGRERSSGGLGVGLAIVKEIVDRHNGWVNVDSREGEGSTFTINIPLVKEDDEKQGKKKQDGQGSLQRVTRRFTRTAESRDIAAAEGSSTARRERSSKREKQPRKERQQREKQRPKDDAAAKKGGSRWRIQTDPKSWRTRGGRKSEAQQDAKEQHDEPDSN